MKNFEIKLSDYGFNILQIESYAACNMECSFCPYPLKDDKESKLSLEDIKKVIDQIDPKDPKFDYITFSQFNEPLLDNRIFDLIGYAQERGLKVLLITNGLLLNKKKNIENLFKYMPTIKISLQVIDQNVHSKARGLNLELQKYSKTIFDFCKLANEQCKDLDISIDVGCSFNESGITFLLKKIMGLQVGDPSVAVNKKDLFKNLDLFIKDLSQINNDYFLNNNMNYRNGSFNLDYRKQAGFKISENIKLKIKPFFYGRRMKDFEPIPSDIFSCHNQILGILSDGSVLPCCLAYDDSISLGNIKEKNLYNILDQNIFLRNLRDKKGEKHITCRKCYGEPTKRGVIFRQLKSKIQNFMKSV